MNAKLSESQEFHRWLKRHDNHLRHYEPDEIARLALTCGFSLAAICPGVTDRLSLLQRLIAFWESPLAANWLRLCEYENGRDH